MAKNVLGRGLGALFQARPPGTGAPGSSRPGGIAAVSPVPAPGESVRKLPLDQIQSSPYQPRKDFKPDSLKELVDSIREQGIIQPLIVRKVGDHYELIAGERRWRAAKTLELTEAPAIVRGPATRRSLNSPSSRTSSGPTSTSSKRRTPTIGWRASSACGRRTSPARSARAARRWPTPYACSTWTTRCNAG